MWNLLIYPSISNTTAVTKDTDQSFGCFKTCFRKDIDKVTSDRLAAEKSVLFNASIIGLLVFGSMDKVTNMECYKNALAAAFLPLKNRAAQAALGAAPLIMTCLHSDKV